MAETKSSSTAARWVVSGVGLLIAVAAVVGAIAFLVPDDKNSTLRQLADKARGDEWKRLNTDTFQADLPAPPSESRWTPGLGHPRPGRTWRSSGDGLVVVVSVAPIVESSAAIDGEAAAHVLVDGIVQEASGTTAERQAVTVLGAVGVDAVVSRADGGTLRVRAVVLGGAAHLFVVQGSDTAFRRVTDSFRLTSA